MALFCACSGTLQNTGVPGTQKVISDATNLIIVPLIADDGTRNEILETDTIDAAYITAALNNADPSKRWYPVGDFVNVTDERAAPITESFTDGSTAITRQGLRAFTGWLLSYSSKYVEILNSFRCRKIGVYAIDDCGDLVGSISSDGTALRPVRLNESSFYATLIKASDTVAGKVQLTFNVSQLEKDSSLRKIDASEVTGSFVDLTGLITVDVQNVGSIATTGFVADLRIVYDNFLTDTVVTGWVLADFDLYNTTTSSTIVITSVTEAPDGTYTFVIPAQTSADVLRLRSSKDGYFLEETITIP